MVKAKRKSSGKRGNSEGHMSSDVDVVSTKKPKKDFFSTKPGRATKVSKSDSKTAFTGMKGKAPKKTARSGKTATRKGGKQRKTPRNKCTKGQFCPRK